MDLGEVGSLEAVPMFGGDGTIETAGTLVGSAFVGVACSIFSSSGSEEGAIWSCLVLDC